MKMEQPDKIFRKKLEQYQRPAPASAWDKIDANLNKKSNKGLWLKIAASLLLLALAGGYWLWPTPKPSRLAVEKNNTDSIIKTPVKKKNTQADETVIMPAPVAKQIKRNFHKHTPIIKNESIEHHQEEIISETPSKNQSHEELLITQHDVINHKDSINTSVVSTHTAEVAAVENSTTLIYTADDVNKYLTRNVEPQATTEVQKQSTFKKLLNKAYGLKNNQDPLGGLRQKKNEILALNFKKEKRGQNK